MVQLPSKKLVVLAALVVASPVATVAAQTPSVSAAKTKQWPVLPEKAPSNADVHGASAQDAPSDASDAEVNQAWTAAEIETARARCNAVLARTQAVVTPMEPLREGDCGSPYPVQLTSVARVTLSQPAIVNCDVVATLADWLNADVQPAAKQYLGGRVEKIDVISSYSCRNAYGRKKTKLSEHGRANALDIKSFAVASGVSADVLADWGMTERDIKARIAAAEAAAKAQAIAKAKADAEAAAAAAAVAQAAKARNGPAPSVVVRRDEGPALGVGSSNGLAALRGVMTGTMGGLGSGDVATGLSLAPSRLGGPKPKDDVVSGHPQAPATKPRVATAPPTATGTANNARQAFLKQIHASACRRFGTVLGPEANNAHRNHFHLDMAERGVRGSFCE